MSSFNIQQGNGFHNDNLSGSFYKNTSDNLIQTTDIAGETIKKGEERTISNGLKSFLAIFAAVLSVVVAVALYSVLSTLFFSVVVTAAVLVCCAAAGTLYYAARDEGRNKIAEAGHDIQKAGYKEAKGKINSKDNSVEKTSSLEKKITDSSYNYARKSADDLAYEKSKSITMNLSNSVSEYTNPSGFKNGLVVDDQQKMINSKVNKIIQIITTKDYNTIRNDGSIDGEDKNTIAGVIASLKEEKNKDKDLNIDFDANKALDFNGLTEKNVKTLKDTIRNEIYRNKTNEPKFTLASGQIDYAPSA